MIFSKTFCCSILTTVFSAYTYIVTGVGIWLLFCDITFWVYDEIATSYLDQKLVQLFFTIPERYIIRTYPSKRVHLYLFSVLVPGLDRDTRGVIEYGQTYRPANQALYELLSA